MKAIVIIIKSIYALITIVAMFFASMFWLGTKEYWDFRVSTNFIEFLFSRFLLVLIVGLLFYVPNLFLNLFFRKRINLSLYFILFEIGGIILIAISLTFYSFS